MPDRLAQPAVDAYRDSQLYGNSAKFLLCIACPISALAASTRIHHITFEHFQLLNLLKSSGPGSNVLWLVKVNVGQPVLDSQQDVWTNIDNICHA